MRTTPAHHYQIRPATEFITVTFSLILLASIAMSCRKEETSLPGRLLISQDGHSILSDDGTPFFYLSDTAWELLHRLNREETLEYLTKRAQQGFNVIQAVSLSELGGLDVPNAYGYLPLEDRDPVRPLTREGDDNDYWDHVDWTVREANRLGLYMALLPTWGSWWHDGENPPFNQSNARIFGEWMGRRYRDCQVIWILGGDRNPESPEQASIIRAMAEGLREGDGGSHLISYHPGGSYGSKDFFADAGFLDLDMRQNGHNVWYEVYAKTLRDYSSQPVRPVLDAEPIYEDHPVAFDADRRGHSIAADCRRALYWDLMGGAAGHTYGHHSVWQMFEQGKREPVNRPLMSWRQALDQPGASQMRIGKDLMMSRPFLGRIPLGDGVIQSRGIPSAWPGSGMYRFSAIMTSDASCMMVYVPVGRSFLLDTSVLEAEDLTGWWFNPRTGEATSIGRIARDRQVEITPPMAGEMTDWVLVIDDRSKGYGKPGTAASGLAVIP